MYLTNNLHPEYTKSYLQLIKRQTTQVYHISKRLEQTLYKERCINDQYTHEKVYHQGNVN